MKKTHLSATIVLLAGLLMSTLIAGCAGRSIQEQVIPPEDLLMPQASILVQGRLSSETAIDVSAILKDADLSAREVEGYVVWTEPLSDFSSQPTIPQFVTQPYPDTVTLHFALSGNGSFYFGAEGPMPDVLAVVGSLYWGYGRKFGLWDSPGCPTYWRKDSMDEEVATPDDGLFEPRDIALVGLGWKAFLDLELKGHISNIPYYDSNFRRDSHIRVKHRLAQPIWVVFYPVWVAARDEWGDWGVGLPTNARWSQFASIFDNGTAQRSVRVKYVSPTASYIYCSLHNNNGEETWVALDSKHAFDLSNWGFRASRLYNEYPELIELGGRKSWSTINTSITMTVVGDSVEVFDWYEEPSSGLRRNPPPDVVLFGPDQWLASAAVVETSQDMQLPVSADGITERPAVPSNELRTQMEQETVQSLREMIMLREQLLEQVQVKQEAAAATEMDVQSAQLKLSEARFQLAVAEQKPDVAMEVFRIILAIHEAQLQLLESRSEQGLAEPGEVAEARLQLLEERIRFATAIRDMQ